MKVRTFVFIALTALILGVSATRSPANNSVRNITFDVTVTDKDGNPVVGLQKADFKVFEDNVEQTIVSFETRQKPLAVVILAEFSDAFAYYTADVIRPAERFVQSLQPKDWIALVSFESQQEIVVDFTHDKTALLAGLRNLQMPYGHDATLFDALYFVLDRLNKIEGLEEKKAIFLLSTGRDTFRNRHSYADVLKKAAASGTTMYAVGPAQPLTEVTYPDPDPGARFRLSEAVNTLRSLAEGTGGLSFFPQFEGQYHGIQKAVNADLRHRYTLGFTSSSTRQYGKIRRLKVKVADTDINQDGKPDKLTVRHQEGHYGPAS